jgi:N utilization substance protein B
MAIKQQWKKRIDVFRFIYSTLVNNEEKNTIIANAFNNFDFDANQQATIEYYANNKDELIASIKPLLKQNWSWERIALIDQSILIDAISEFKALGVDRKIIIDQAVINAKNYSNETSFKFINAILDKII